MSVHEPGCPEAGEPSERGRCNAESPQGLRCGLAAGHKGEHNALGWAVAPAAEEPREDA